jgi:pyruvate,water dikinase
MASTGLVPRFVVFEAEWVALNEADLPSALAQAVGEEDLRPPFAVRSSASDEDGHDAAFAGMYDTRLGVTHRDLPDAVLGVTRSGDSERIRAYRAALDFPSSPAPVDVVVQEMVDACVAGVAFSRDPMHVECVRVEAVRGLGEALVSGGAIPEALVVGRSDFRIHERHSGRQYIEFRRDGTQRRLTGREIRATRLSDDQARLIARQACSLEATFPEASRGVDVEWAIDHEGIKLLQCRPITSSSGRPSRPPTK